VLEVIGNQTSLEIKADEGKYLGVKGISNDLTRIALYNDAPAINEKLELNSAITEINGIKIDGIEKLQQELLKYSPGEKIVLGIFDGEDIHNQDITLGENPENKSIGLIGIGFENDKRSGVLGKIYNTLSSFKKQYIYYESRMGDFGWFIYYLLWWLVLICVGVALMNMLPVGIFDGGRFFYLTVLAITKSEKKAKRYFSIVTYFFLFLLLLLMIFWATSFIR
ncbi:MAG TPA: RIP metalloprotease, partial [Candidatus Pacearchaeota archaeon]|nr:RIP metalloprotease [Candidatus Pacearchaeota archaeon]